MKEEIQDTQETIIAHWADVFPEMEAHPTNDPRIFQTNFKKMNASRDKIKTYFCCVIGRDCYGIDVIRPWASNAAKKCEEAYFNCKFAADYFEQNGTWPETS